MYKIALLYFSKRKFQQNKTRRPIIPPLQVFNKIKKILAQKQFYNNLKHELLKKTRQLEEIQTNTWKNRRFLQITQTRTQHERNTHQNLSQKQSI